MKYLYFKTKPDANGNVYSLAMPLGGERKFRRGYYVKEPTGSVTIMVSRSKMHAILLMLTASGWEEAE